MNKNQCNIRLDSRSCGNLFFERFAFLCWQLIVIAAFTLLLAFPAHAEYVRFSSGTGFFVSANGHIVTNEHVVKECESISVVGSKPETPAKLLESDEANDLALLKADVVPSEVANLRTDESTLAAGAKAIVIGYALDKGFNGQYTLKETTIADTRGPGGQENWIQFSNSVQQGNSGGPLLDDSGNVIGVVAMKSLLTSYNWLGARQETISDNDVAISLATLKQFLSDNQVYFRTNESSINLQGQRIELKAKQFIVNVRCRLK